MSARKRKSRKPGPQPWYASGLRFTCLPECGKCCTNHDDYSYVYLEGDDLPRLAAHLHLTEQEFRRRFTTLDDDNVVLRMDEPDCPFLDGWRCTVYEARPTQCSTFPFWKDALVDRTSWIRLRGFCPGIEEGDEIHSLEVIQAHLAARDPD